MLSVSSTYLSLSSDVDATKEYRLTISASDGTSSTVYDESYIYEMTISRSVFKDSTPSVGGTVSATLTATLKLAKTLIPRMAKIVVEFRLAKSSTVSEWLPLGTFYVDTKEQDYSSGRTSILAYDSMLKAQISYPNTTTWTTKNDINVLNEIATAMGVDVDSRVATIMTNAYTVLYPGTTYTCREVLGFLGAMYAGNFIITNENKLMLIQMNSLPNADYYVLGDESSYGITFGTGTETLLKVGEVT